MCKYIIFGALIALVTVLSMGCGGKGAGTIDPAIQQIQGISQNAATEPLLWGYYDIYVDQSTDTATVVPNRGGMFTANVGEFSEPETRGSWG